MVVAVCGITFAFQTNTYAKKNFKVTPSKVEKQSKKSFRTITTKYTKHYLGLNAFLDKMEKAGGGTLTIKKGTYRLANCQTVLILEYDVGTHCHILYIILVES